MEKEEESLTQTIVRCLTGGIKMKKTPFDMNNIAYVISWTDWKSYESDGDTIVKNIEDLNKEIEFRIKGTYYGLEQGDPKIYQFSNLDDVLKGEKQRYFGRLDDDFPEYSTEYRELTKKELNIVYDSLKYKLIELFSPSELEGWVLPMFCPDD